MIYNRFKKIILGTLTCTKFIWSQFNSTLSSEVVFLKMPSRNQKKRSKQRAEYLQKQDENRAKARALYKANPEKKASVRDSYKADPEKKRPLHATATRPIPKRRPLLHGRY